MYYPVPSTFLLISIMFQIDPKNLCFTRQFMYCYRLALHFYIYEFSAHHRIKHQPIGNLKKLGYYKLLFFFTLPWKQCYQNLCIERNFLQDFSKRKYKILHMFFLPSLQVFSWPILSAGRAIALLPVLALALVVVIAKC